MASVLKSFLIAIGIDSTEATKGARTVERSIGGIKSSAMQAGAALVGVFGAKALTADFARRVDTLNMSAKALDVNTSAVQALGNAFAVTGGDADSALGVLQKLTQARDALAVKGEAGFLTDAAFSGIDPSLIKDAENSYDALLNIVEQFPSLSAAQQRTLAETLGVGPAELNLFKSGRATLEGHISTLEKIRPVTEKAVEESRRLRGEFSLLQTQIGGVADTVSVPLIGALADATEYANKFIDANRPLIDGTVGKGIEIASDNFTALAVAVGGIAAAGTLGTIGALAKYIPGIGAGLGTIATNLSKVGGIAAAAGVSSVVADVADKTLAANIPGYEEFDAKLTRGMYDLTGFDLSRGNVNEGTERKSLNPWKDVSDPYIEAVRNGPSFLDTMSEMFSVKPVEDGKKTSWTHGNPEFRNPEPVNDVNLAPPIVPIIKPTVSMPDFSPSAPVYNNTYNPPEVKVVMPDAPTSPVVPSTPPARIPPVQVQLQLDGRVLDERIIDVHERIATSTMDDLATTTVR